MVETYMYAYIQLTLLAFQLLYMLSASVYDPEIKNK